MGMKQKRWHASYGSKTQNTLNKGNLIRENVHLLPKRKERFSLVFLRELPLSSLSTRIPYTHKNSYS